MNNLIELFVPGRLCLLGEHSDWAGKYRSINPNINKGYAIVTGIEQGIRATIKTSDRLVVSCSYDNSLKFECDMDLESLKKIASEGGYWCYIAGVAAVIKEQYNVKGLDITLTEINLPIKKGLSSSAAICVLVARAFNQLYNLHLNTIGEMNLAYTGEILTPSRCGRLDQACAFGKKPVLMTFDGDQLDVKNIKVGEDFYFVFADLMSKKDTIKILADLNRCYPFPESEIDKNVSYGLGELNEQHIIKAVELLEKGDTKSFGDLMNMAQNDFDKYVAPACAQELTAPVLHKFLNDSKICELTYGRKGVGSQGDGTVQFLAKGKEEQLKLKEYLIEMGLQPYEFTINKTKPITKAIIPLAGNGTRMYPITKIMKKAFLPIIDEDGICKPCIMSLLEELDNAGIEKICLIIDKEDQKEYDKFFNEPLSDEVSCKLSPKLLEYENRIHRIGRKLTYVYQKEKLGLGHAVSLCNKFANGDNVLLVLGDQIYKSNNGKSCTSQLLDFFEKNEQLMVSVFNVPLESVSKYGILTGKIEKNDNYFYVDKMTEKPEPSFAEEYLYTSNNSKKEYYSVFGEYILTSDVFKILDEHIHNNVLENNEFQITSALDEVREKNGMLAFIPDGIMLDLGNVESYKNTLIEKCK